MRAGLVFASRNEGQNLRGTVRSCQETTEGLDVEIVVADDASTDGSLAGLERLPQVRVVSHKEQLEVSPTKNLAGRISVADVLIFLDGHCKPEPGAIARLIVHLWFDVDRELVVHQISDRFRVARKNFIELVWRGWIEWSRDCHPDWRWEQGWSAFEERRASVQERAYSMANRVGDESW